MNKITLDRLKQLQSLPLDEKISYSECAIQEWYEYWNGEVYVAFSGGKDSTVMLDLVRRLYPEVLGVFHNTGLEYPEVVRFVKSTKNTLLVKPKMSFREVLKKYGYPVVSKQIALKIRTIRRNPDNAIAHYYLTGYKKDGGYNKNGILSKKWRFLIDAPFNTSEKCCDVMKKRPSRLFERQTGKKPYIGNMASEGYQRLYMYLRYGCNSFNGRNALQSNPLSFWLEEDIWHYIKRHDLPYSSIYDKGIDRTGCMFCMFGVHMEKYPNRFQTMNRMYPKHYNYCINKLGLGKILDYIKVPYRTRKRL